VLHKYSHRRLNILNGEWVLVSPHRAQRPWHGKIESLKSKKELEYDDSCYLCPGNKRANGELNPNYDSTFIFTNDFSSLTLDDNNDFFTGSDLLLAKREKGICKVVCFSRKHNLTLAELEVSDIELIINTWQTEYQTLGSHPDINYVQIFENKGEIMGCSNSHPHGQIWAQNSIPGEASKEGKSQLEYYIKNNKTILSEYLNIELEKKERIIYENKGFVLLVPFWAVWPFETLIISKRSISNILQLNRDEIVLLSEIIKVCTVKYDNIFNISFPYSSGIHQAPTDKLEHKEWHFHMHFYPPLLRSATVKKFMVGYELLAEPQRDITPEKSAEILKSMSIKHYKLG
jgi:UDPglucose--hexose-1-phosphate uridylyltransferase